MKTVLIAYATTEGQTRKIAQFIAEHVRKRGHEAELIDTADAKATSVQPIYAGAFLAGSVHQGKHQTALAHFVKSNLDWLNKLPCAMVSVSLAAAGQQQDDHAEAQKALDAFLHETGLTPGMQVCVAGALKYTQYDFFKRWIMKMISKKTGRVTDTSTDFEYTDWAGLETFIDEYMSHAQIDGRKAA